MTGSSIVGGSSRLTARYGAKLCTTPCDISTTASTSDSGSKTYSVLRVKSTQKLPIVVDFAPREAADQRDEHGHARGSGQEVLHGEPEHLREIAHRGFADVALPIGVGREAHGRVERRVRAHGARTPAG